MLWSHTVWKQLREVKVHLYIWACNYCSVSKKYAGYTSILFSTDLVVDFWDKDEKVCILAVSVVFKPVSLCLCCPSSLHESDLNAGCCHVKWSICVSALAPLLYWAARLNTAAAPLKPAHTGQIILVYQLFQLCRGWDGEDNSDFWPFHLLICVT